MQSSVLPAPGDLLRREGPGLFPVRFVEAERRWVDFSTLHSGETTHSGSPLNALPFLYQQTCSLFSEFLWHELNKQLYRQYGPGNATYVESLSGSVVTHDYGVTETVKKHSSKVFNQNRFKRTEQIIVTNIKNTLMSRFSTHQ